MKLKSTQVEVFPIAKQRKQILEGDKNLVRGTKILTEKNISNIIRQLLGEASPGFVISCTQDITTKLYNVEFNLYGYYFNISDLNVSSFNSAVYAEIKIDKNVDEISGQDVQSTSGDKSFEYGGLNLTESPSSEEDVLSLKILEKTNDSWHAPIENFGFMTSQIIGGIDGKPRA